MALLPTESCSPEARAGRPGTTVPPRAWLAVLVVGGVLFLVAERTVAVTSEQLLVPTVLLLGAATVPAAAVALVWGRLPGRVGAPLVTGTAVVGGAVAAVLAGAAESAVRHQLGALPAGAVAVVEETSKVVVPLAVLLLSGRPRSGADGLLLGISAGAGFAVLETTGYACAAVLASGGDLDPGTVDELLLRGVLSPAGHVAWTGVVVGALFAAAAAGWRVRGVAALVGASALAVALHTAWDVPVTVGGSAVAGRAAVAVLSLGALGWALHRAAGGRTVGGRAGGVGPGGR